MNECMLLLAYLTGHYPLPADSLPTLHQQTARWSGAGNSPRSQPSFNEPPRRTARARRKFSGYIQKFHRNQPVAARISLNCWAGRLLPSVDPTIRPEHLFFSSQDVYDAFHARAPPRAA